MSRRRRGARKNHRPRRKRPGREWVGGLFWPPIAIESPTPDRAGWVVWLELPDRIVVGQRVVGPDTAAGALSSTLLEAMAQPLTGEPRRPGRIRVVDENAAAEVRAELGKSIPVRIAPTPELNELIEDVIKIFPDSVDHEESYYADGKISPEAVADLFSASSCLLDIAPWTSASDTQFLRMNIPDLGIDGACISIVGRMGAVLGFMVFPSMDSVDAFVEAPAPGSSPREPFNSGSDYLRLTFASAAEASELMRIEAAHCGWPAEEYGLFPVVHRTGGDGLSFPLEERDVAVAVSCARALVAFFAKHGDRFESNTPTPVFESVHVGRDREVELSFPYEAFEGFRLTEAKRSAGPSSPGAASRSLSGTRVGRDDPSPGRQWTEVREIPSGGRRGQVCRFARRGPVAHIGLPDDEAPHPVRFAGIRTCLEQVQGRICGRQAEFPTLGAVVGLLL